MTLFAVKGVVTALGPCTTGDDGSLYGWIELTEQGGRRVSVENVYVGNTASRAVAPDTIGEFYFDRMVRLVPGAILKQLYGVKTADGIAVFDKVNLRFVLALTHIFRLLPLSIFFAGAPAVFGVGQLLKAFFTAAGRRNAFYGTDPDTAAEIRRQEAVCL